MEQNGLFAQVNDSIRKLASHGPDIQTWEFICECPEIKCHELVSLTLNEFDARRTAAPPVPILAVEHGASVSGPSRP
jgi:hypothetical protein